MDKTKIFVRNIQWACAPRGHEERNVGLPGSVVLEVDIDDFDEPLEINEFVQEWLSNTYGVVANDFDLRSK